MAKLLDKILVVDVEATCWEGKTPDDQESEIIEVGICELNVQTKSIERNEGILVKPERSEISDFCTTLTSITPTMVETGMTFEQACDYIKKEYLSTKRVWASYGAYDLNQFKRQADSFNVPYPFGPSHINVKTLYAIQRSLVREEGMAGALRGLGLPLEGVHHRGVDDAKNIANILKHILW